MKKISIFLLAILVLSSINCQLEHQRPERTDYEVEELLDDLTKKLNRNKQEYPDGFQLGKQSNTAEVFAVKKNKGALSVVNKPVSVESDIIVKNNGNHDSSKSWKVFFILCILGNKKLIFVI